MTDEEEAVTAEAERVYYTSRCAGKDGCGCGPAELFTEVHDMTVSVHCSCGSGVLTYSWQISDGHVILRHLPQQ